MAGKSLKATTKKPVEQPINNEASPIVETMDKSVVNVELKSVAAPKKKFEQTETIMCRSIVSGVLVMGGRKSNNTYIWNDCGDETEVEYQDLVSEIRSQSNYIYAPHFVIEDEDFLKEFPQVQKIYDSMYTLTDLREIINLPLDLMVANIEVLPQGAKDNLINMAATMITQGALDSVSKIKKLDEMFGTQYMMATGLFS